ncbi:MAG: hypothetical protein Q9218_007201 [Villophora microphyllina]
MENSMPPPAAAQPWSWRPPSPPHVYIPPPALDKRGNPDVQIQLGTNHDFESSGFANSDFLSTVTHGDYQVGSGMFDWRYESRRTAQQILPFLYLGPITAARDPKFLQKNGITLVMAIRDTKSAVARVLGSKAAEELGIPYVAVDTAGNQELIAAFPRGIEIINGHLSAMHQHGQATQGSNNAPALGKVLVFCESGNERSASMVVAYLMAMYSMDVVKSIQIVQAQRFAVAFDDPLKVLLQTYESILQAKRDVLVSGRQISTLTTTAIASSIPSIQAPKYHVRKPTKRTLDDHYEDETDVDGNGDMTDGARFEKRDGSAPFFDTAGP